MYNLGIQIKVKYSSLINLSDCLEDTAVIPKFLSEQIKVDENCLDSNHFVD